MTDTTPRSRATTRREFLQVGGAGAVLLGGAALLSGCGSGSGATATAVSSGPSSSPKSGGTLRIGASGGGPADTVDVQNPNAQTDYTRTYQLADPLVRYNPTTALTELALAEEATPNADFTVWTVRIRKGVILHNGREFTSDDVLASFQRIYDPKAPLPGAGLLQRLDVAGIKVVDRYTVQLPMKAPFNDLLDTLGSTYFMMVPRGFDPKKPIGTGPFKLQSFTAGVQSTTVRNEAYWRSVPHLDSIVTTNLTDETSQVNALLNGQVDVIDVLSAASVAVLKSGGAQVVISQTGQWNPIVMRTDIAPFNDVRVRQAFRLIADRSQMNNLVTGGQGLIGNDVWSIYDPRYDHSLPQRVQDIAQAKSLLKAAGHDGLRLDYPVANVAQGVVSMAQIYAEQASKAGVTLNLKQQSVSDYFAVSYQKNPLEVSFWPYQPYFATVGVAFVPGAPFTETNWKSAAYASLYTQAITTKSDALKTEIAHQMQKIDYDQGGELIPFYAANIDAASKRVGGLVSAKTGFPLSGYDFANFWLK